MAAPPKPLSVDIHSSVKEGDIPKVYEFLEEGGDVNVRCRFASLHQRPLFTENGCVRARASLVLYEYYKPACTAVATYPMPKQCQYQVWYRQFKR